MWFPYSLPAQWKAESPREQINESLADQSLRDFLVGFYLRNPVSREWEVELQLESPQWQSGRTSDDGGLEIGFYPGENGRLAEVMFRLRGTQPGTALMECYGQMSRILDEWAVTHGRGFAISGFRVADLTNDARWRVLPHRPSAESFRLPREEQNGEAWLAAASLYREARNGASPAYRLLCLGKLLGLWWAGTEPFEEGPREPDDQLVVSQEKLVLSGYIRYRPDLEGRGLSGLLPEAEEWRQWALERLAGTGLPEPIEDFATVSRAEALANLLDMAVQDLLSRCAEESRTEKVEA